MYLCIGKKTTRKVRHTITTVYIMITSMYYIDFVNDSMYNILVRRSDDAILYSNEDLDNVIAEAKKRGIKKEDLVIY